MYTYVSPPRIDHCCYTMFNFYRILKGKSLCDWPSIRTFCDELYSKSIRSPFLLSLLIDLYEEDARKGEEGAQDNVTKAVEVKMCNVEVMCSS